jgi:hypothetical protein
MAADRLILPAGSLESPSLMVGNWGFYQSEENGLVVVGNWDGSNKAFADFRPPTIGSGKPMFRLLEGRYIQFEGPHDGAPCLFEWEDTVRNRKFSFGINDGRAILRDITNTRNPIVLYADAPNLALTLDTDGTLKSNGDVVATV